jgi:hypothetical protein
MELLLHMLKLSMLCMPLLHHSIYVVIDLLSLRL